MNIIEKQIMEEKLHEKLINSYSEKLIHIESQLAKNSKASQIIKVLEKNNDLIPLVYDYMKSITIIDDESVEKISNLIGYIKLLNARFPEAFDYYISLYLTQIVSIHEIYNLLHNNSTKRCMELHLKLKQMNYAKNPMPLNWAIAMVGEL